MDSKKIFMSNFLSNLWNKFLEWSWQREANKQFRNKK